MRLKLNSKSRFSFLSRLHAASLCCLFVSDCFSFNLDGDATQCCQSYWVLSNNVIKGTEKWIIKWDRQPEFVLTKKKQKKRQPSRIRKWNIIVRVLWSVYYSGASVMLRKHWTARERAKCESNWNQTKKCTQQKSETRVSQSGQANKKYITWWASMVYNVYGISSSVVSVAKRLKHWKSSAYTLSALCLLIQMKKAK